MMQSPKELRDENASLRKQITNLVQRKKYVSRELISLDMRINNKSQYIKNNIELMKEVGKAQTKRDVWIKEAKSNEQPEIPQPS